MEETKCEVCGKVVPTEELSEFDGKMLCSQCLREETVICDHCGIRIWADEDQGNEGLQLCQRCFDDHYTCCTECDRVIHFDDALYEGDDPYCRRCYEDHRDDRVIHDYYYKPAPIFYGEGNRFFGVELEVDEGGELNENAEKVMDIANEKNYLVYCKHDGSLNDGFEIVTHPMTLEYHQKNVPWEDIMRTLISDGYLSHQSGTAGLHIHVNRTAFGEIYEEQDACIARVLYFFEKHWEELLKFSRRSENQLRRWAARYGLKENPREILDHAKKGYGNGRYTCVNLENNATIEFRMFRGTLKYNSFIATLQLVNHICDVAICFSDDEIRDLSWTSFVSGCLEPELVQYLKERRIYINDPIISEEEV